MSRAIQSIAVLGLGKVGHLVAELLVKTGYSVTGFDQVSHSRKSYSTKILDVTNGSSFNKALADFDALVSCLPYHFNLDIARFAHDLSKHYFDLTEDVPTTKAIIEMSTSAKSVMAPQCGLAPGFIAIVGSSLASQFSSIRSIKLRVGALPQNPTGLLGYAFNWSPEGVVNEYLNDCEVIENGEHKWVSPMEWIETLVIQGIQLEAFTTSGGLGTMCETYLGKIENLDYKSIRYPGHVKLMNFFFHELLMREDRAMAGKILTNAKPAVSDDVVFVHASCEGHKDEQLLRDEFVRAYYPVTIGRKERRAISWTTAASACAVIELVSSGVLPNSGFIRQEDIPLADFLKTKNGRLYDGKKHGGKL